MILVQMALLRMNLTQITLVLKMKIAWTTLMNKTGINKTCMNKTGMNNTCMNKTGINDTGMNKTDMNDICMNAPVWMTLT
jgi:hypothetical protein